MLVTESEKARLIRSKILDIVLDVMAQKSGGHPKYINQRDEAYLPSAYKEYSYRIVSFSTHDRQDEVLYQKKKRKSGGRVGER